MKRLAILSTLAGLVAAFTPASAGASPYGMETNPIGSLVWLPDNANEKPTVGNNEFRLVVAYDRSLNAQGGPTDLLAKGPFGIKFMTANIVDAASGNNGVGGVRMVEHSPAVDSLDDAAGNDAVDPVDTVFAGVAGDVRDGACSKIGTAAFSAAYSTTRTFFHPGSTAYEPISAPGTCEVVDSSVAAADGSGFTTTVTTHVPGFWIDVTWPVRTVPQAGTGRLAPEVWYSGVYDTQGQDGDFYETADAQGASKSVWSPGAYDFVFSFTAQAGSFGDGACPAFPSAPQANQDAHEDVKVQVPAGTTKATFKLFPKGDWDLRVIDPAQTEGDSGWFGGIDETEVVPSAGNGNIPELIPGEFTMRACNYTGEPTVIGAVIIE